MENLIPMSDVQYLNLNILLTITAHLKRDWIGAMYRFQLSPDQATKLAGMSLDTIQILAANMRHESLFTPRENFLQLLDAPPGLALVLCAVSPNKAEVPAAPAGRTSLQPACL